MPDLAPPPEQAHDPIDFAAGSNLPKIHSLFAALLLVALARSAGALDKAPDECGLASVYASTSEETASGENTLAENFTAAHRTLPFGTLVRVNNRTNGRSTVVRVTDRGPFIAGRIIDVSKIAARDLGFDGLAEVCLSIVLTPESQPKIKD